MVEDMIKESNPRVLIVHTQIKLLGGAELLIVELANWLTKRGIRNDILALSSSLEVREKLINTEIIIPKHNIDLRPPGFKNGKDITFWGGGCDTQKVLPYGTPREIREHVLRQAVRLQYYPLSNPTLSVLQKQFEQPQNAHF